MFCDADDYLEPDAVQKLVQAMPGVDLVCGSFRKFGKFDMTVTHETSDLSTKQVAEYVMGNLANPRTNQFLSGCWAKLYRHRLVGKFPNLTTAEDMAFNFDYLTRCSRVKFLSDVVYHNQKREGSLSTTFDLKNKMGLFGFLEGLAYVERFLRGHVQSYETRKAMDYSKVYHSMLYFMRICEHTKQPMNEVFKTLYP
jgi:hypothetical protein